MLSTLSIAVALSVAVPATGTSRADHTGDAAISDPPTACALATDTLAALGTEAGDELPDTPAGRQLRWVLEQSADAGADDLAARFSTEFLDAVPAPQLLAIFAEIGTAEFAIVEVVPFGATQLAAVLETPEGAVVATIVVEAEPPHRIAGLLFQPGAADVEPLPADAEAITAAAAALPGETRVLVAEVTSDLGMPPTFDPLVAQDVDTAGPIASTFKLWVVWAVAEAIAAGEVAWSDTVTIDPAVRSLPSGELQNCPDGSTVTIEQAATLMIAISDNTATDALIELVGRDAVEAQLGHLDVSDEAQERTLPLLTTAEMFELKFSGDAALLDQYVAGDEAARRAILSELPGTLPTLDQLAAIGTRPIAVDTVEWFATPDDIARTLVGLGAIERDERMAPLDTILGTNPGVEIDPDTWSRAWFKGGSEPGVVTLAWLLARADDRQFVVVVMNMDTASGEPAPEIELIADAAIRLAAEHP